MELDKVTKKSINLDQPDEKIQFEIFKTLSGSQLLTNFDEILTFCLPYKGVENLFTAFSRTSSYRPVKSCPYVSALNIAIVYCCY